MSAASYKPEHSQAEPIDIEMIKMLRECDMMLLDVRADTDTQLQDMNRLGISSPRSTSTTKSSLTPPSSPNKIIRDQSGDTTKPAHKRQSKQYRVVQSVPSSPGAEPQVRCLSYSALRWACSRLSK